MIYRPTWELDTIPDAAWASEHGRRNSSRVVNRSGGRNGGRKAIPTACPKCGVICSQVREARAHCRVARK